MKFKKVTKYLVLMICLAGVIFEFPAASASAATQKKQPFKKSYSFVDTSGAVCGVTVEGNIRESYVTEGNKVKYTERSGFLGMTVTGNASINARNVTFPKHFTSAGKVYNSFSDWKFQDYIVSKETKVLFSQHSSTSVQYQKSNTYYAQMSFSIGNDSFVLQPYQSGKIKMSLGL